MMGKQHYSGEIVRPVRLEPYSRPLSHDYLEIPINKDILKALGWLPGDEDIYLHLKPQIEDKEGGSFVFLEVSLGEEGERESYKLKHDRGYSVTLPTTWEEHKQDYKGYSNPFYGLESGDQVVVVGLPDENEVRIYHPEDYREKTGLDIRAPSLAVFASSLFSDDFVNIAEQTPYTGQKWEIIPFNAQHPVFDNEDIIQSTQRSDPPRSDTDFERVADLNRIPTVRARRIRIWWNPFYKHPYHPEKNETVTSKPVTMSIEDGAFVIYKDYLTRRSRVVLPEKGAYIIEADVRDGFGWLAAGFYRDSTEWDVRYFTEEEDCLRMYVPTPTEFKDGREPDEVIDWMNGAYGSRSR